MKTPVSVLVLVAALSAAGAWMLRGALEQGRLSAPRPMPPPAPSPSAVEASSLAGPGATLAPPAGGAVSIPSEANIRAPEAAPTPRFNEQGLRACQRTRLAYEVYLVSLLGGSDGAEEGNDARAARTQCARFLAGVPPACWKMANAYDDAITKLRTDPASPLARQQALAGRRQALRYARDCPAPR